MQYFRFPQLGMIFDHLQSECLCHAQGNRQGKKMTIANDKDRVSDQRVQKMIKEAEQFADVIKKRCWSSVVRMEAQMT